MLTRRLLACIFCAAIFVWFFLCYLGDSQTADEDLYWLARKLGWEKLLFKYF